jgi:hypothetical protein
MRTEMPKALASSVPDEDKIFFKVPRKLDWRVLKTSTYYLGRVEMPPKLMLATRHCGFYRAHERTTKEDKA